MKTWYRVSGIPGGGILGSREEFFRLVEEAKELGVYRGWSLRIQERVAVGGRLHDKYVLELRDGSQRVYMVRAEETDEAWSERLMMEIEEFEPPCPEIEE